MTSSKNYVSLPGEDEPPTDLEMDEVHCGILLNVGVGGILGEIADLIKSMNLEKKFKNMVHSLTKDPNIFRAILQNNEVQELFKEFSKGLHSSEFQQFQMLPASTTNTSLSVQVGRFFKYLWKWMKKLLSKLWNGLATIAESYAPFLTGTAALSSATQTLGLSPIAGIQLALFTNIIILFKRIFDKRVALKV